ncbi:MAG: DUF3850 domain-containing protein [Candidatus Aenigmarchaeota archaeon]|nr:DUF3850 domain-containing protein [Candidatus Aenigmarchaeota archaeon]
MIIRKKTWPDLFQKVLDGEKNFDMRIADFKCEQGDVLVLEEWDPAKGKYTGRRLEKKVKFVLKSKDHDFWKKEDIEKHGFLVVGFD